MDYVHDRWIGSELAAQLPDECVERPLEKSLASPASHQDAEQRSEAVHGEAGQSIDFSMHEAIGVGLAGRRGALEQRAPPREGMVHPGLDALRLPRTASGGRPDSSCKRTLSLDQRQ